MTTKLESVNTMLSCIGQAPINTLEGTKSSNIVSAENILNDEVENVQLSGWDFNTEEDYPLLPDQDGFIKLPLNTLNLKVEDTYYANQYSIRGTKLYDKINHTYKIDKQLKAKIIFKLEFEDLSTVVQKYITMSAANKFVKRALGSQTTYAYTMEDLAEARAAMLKAEITDGEYSFIPEFQNGEIRKSL